jgi:iron complex outermembrane receptor protein
LGRLTTQLSYNAGNEHTVLGFKTSVDFNTADISTEYALKFGRLSLKPGVAYRSAIYDDTKRGDVSKREGTINGRHVMETYGTTLRGEYTIWKDRIRLTGGLRADKFTHPGGWFVSYQGASSFKVNKNNLFRVVYSKAFRSPFIYDTYQDVQLFLPLGTSPEMYMVNNMLGNKEVHLLSSSMLEFGYRTKISANITVDLEAYSTKTENFTAIVTTTPVLETPQDFPYVGSFDSHTNNIPLWVRQTGATLSVNFNMKSFQFKPFVTIQNTTLHNYSRFANTSNVTPDPTNNFDPLNNNIYSGMGTKIDHKFTPKAYGGGYINYIAGKFNFNVNAYAFTNQTFYHSYNLYFPDGRGVGEVKSKVVLNAKVSFTPVKALTIFVNAKNLLNKRSREHYLSDLTPSMLLGGLTVNL